MTAVLLAFVENSQNSKHERSSILVLMNLFNIRVVNFALFNGVDIIKFCLIPDNDKIIALAKSLPDKYSDKKKYRLILFSHYNGKKITTGKTFQYELNTLLTSNDGLYLLTAPEKESSVILYQADNLKKIQKKIKTPGVVAAAAQGKGFLLGGRDFIVKLARVGSSWKIDRYYEVPAGFSPDKIVVCGFKTFAVIETGGPGFYFNGSIFVKLLNSCGGALAWDAKNRQILLTRQRNSGIIIFTPQTPSHEQQLILPNKIRPRTRGRITGLYPAPEGKVFFALDDKGVFMKLYKAGRRWKKNIILTAQGK